MGGLELGRISNAEIISDLDWFCEFGGAVGIFNIPI